MSRKPSGRRPRSDLGTARQLPSGRWQASYRHQGRSFTAPHTFHTRAEAMTWLSGERSDRARGTWRDTRAGRVTVADYASAWLESRTNLAPRTREHYTSSLARWVTPDLGQGIDLGSIDLADLTPARIRRWFARVSFLAEQSTTQRHTATGTTTHGHPARAWGRANGWQVAATGRISPDLLDAWERSQSEPTRQTRPGRDAARPGAVAACNAYRVLRALCNAAVRDGLLTSTPCTVEGAGSVRHPERTPATPDEVARLAELMPDELAPAVWVAAWSGLRYGELFALARRHIDLEHGSIRVERALNRARQFGPLKTASSLRTVWLPGFVVEQLREHLDRNADAGPDALVWTSGGGAPMRQAHVSKHFRRAARAIGREDLRWHDLRHTGATLAYAAGGNVRDVQRRLGHATARAAMIYAHAADQGDRLLAERLHAVYGPSPDAQPYQPRPALALVTHQPSTPKDRPSRAEQTPVTEVRSA